jgi:hypothetical protein
VTSRSVAFLVVTAAATLSVAGAATLRTIDIDRDDGVYSLHAETFLAASPEDIFEVLLDYDRFSRISRVYKEHAYLAPDTDGTPIVYTRMEGCLLFYCLSMRRVERLEVKRPGHIRTVTMPERSDFKRSSSEWVLEPEAGGTRMTYSLIMEPDFWVTPVIGPWYLKRTLQRGGGNAINRIERLAQAVAAGDGN